MIPPWRPKLYEALDVEDVDGDDLYLESLDGFHDYSELEVLSALVVRHMPPEDLEEVGDLVTLPNGEILYHRLLVLSAAPPIRDNGSFDAAGVERPGDGDDVRYLMTLRDYATKGSAERLWYFADGKLMSLAMRAGAAPVEEIGNVTEYVDALAEALLEEDE